MQEINREITEKAIRECMKKKADIYWVSNRTDEEAEFKAAFFERAKEKSEATFNLSEITDDDITRATDRDLKLNSDNPKIFTDPYGRIVGVANTQYLRMCLDLNAGDTYKVPVYVKDGKPITLTKKDMKCILWKDKRDDDVMLKSLAETICEFDKVTEQVSDLIPSFVLAKPAEHTQSGRTNVKVADVPAYWDIWVIKKDAVEKNTDKEKFTLRKD